MAKFFTLSEAAAQIGCDKSQTSRHARRLGLGLRIGSAIAVTAGELEILRKTIAANRPGNPNLNSRNDLGQFKKSGQKRR